MFGLRRVGNEVVVLVLELELERELELVLEPLLALARASGS